MPHRRHLLAAAALLPLASQAQQRAALVDPLRLGVDTGLADAGLTATLVRSFGFDTGVAVKPIPAPSAEVLEALDRGEIDVSLTDSPQAEERLFNAGLAHDRRQVATAEFVLVGPAATRKQPDPAGIAGGRDAAEALRKIRHAAALYVSANNGSGGHLLELARWRAAQVAPASPWYSPAAAGAALSADARARMAYAVVERGAWARQGGAPLAVLVEGDPRLAVPVHVMRGFRSAHPAAKLFANWIAGARGRRAVASVRGFV